MEELQLKLPNVQLAALRAGEGPPLLMLHGWMDNAASFLPLYPYLSEFDAVALEHAGHGHSGHRPPGHWYHLMDYVADTLAAADALGWPAFNLLGHSLGGAVATLLTVAAPERVRSLAVIEGLGPLAGATDEVVKRLRRSWSQLSAVDPERLRRFESVEQAVHVRQAHGQIQTAVLRPMVQRGLRAEGTHWRWRSDPRLNITTPYRFDESQIQHLMAGIQCPTLVVLSDPPTPLLPLADIEQRIAAVPQGRMTMLPGGHHLHMNHPELLAPVIIDHFK